MFSQTVWLVVVTVVSVHDIRSICSIQVFSSSNSYMEHELPFKCVTEGSAPNEANNELRELVKMKC